MEALFKLEKGIEALKARIRRTEDAYLDPDVEVDVMDDADLDKTRADLDKAMKRRRAMLSALGTEDQRRLKEMSKSDYLRLRMNARALKMRLREKLRARKFELDRVERSFRRLNSGEYGIFVIHASVLMVEIREEIESTHLRRRQEARPRHPSRQTTVQCPLRSACRTHPKEEMPPGCSCPGEDRVRATLDY